MNMHPQQSVEALTRFREQVATARRQVGYLQKDLAAALGLDAETLSRKLHGRHHTILTLQDVKQIIKTLATWQAITTREAEALLERRDATLPDIYYRQYMSKLAGFKAQANEAQWAIWWAEGRALSQEQGIMLALQATQAIL